MTNYRYILEPYTGTKSRYTCPKCQHRVKTFKLYVDTHTGELLADHVGRCDREEQCGYHYTPKEYFKATPGAYQHSNTTMIKTPSTPTHIDTIPLRYMEKSQEGDRPNNFVYFLREMFGENNARELALKYNIGTSNKWPGGTIFWQMDKNGKLRTGKIMLYNVTDCRRVKEPGYMVTWVHHKLYVKTKIKEDFQLRQCLFGEHLLQTDPFKTVAITESEKTAVIASRYYPNLIWLAAGGLEGLTVGKCKVLRDRNVILYPDINGYAKWHTIADELNRRIPGATFKVDQTLVHSECPGDRERGIDIADRWIDERLKEWDSERQWGLRE